MQNKRYLDPNKKARWGFGTSEDGQITVGAQSVGDTGGVKHARSEPEDSNAGDAHASEPAAKPGD